MRELRIQFQDHFTPERPQDSLDDFPLETMRQPGEGQNEIDFEEWFNDLGGGEEAQGVIEDHNAWFGKEFYSLSPDTLEGIVSALRVDKSCGVDGGDNAFMKEVYGGKPELVKEVLTKFANKMLAGRLAERLETTEKANDVQRQMLEAAARRPRDRNELAERLREGRF